MDLLIAGGGTGGHLFPGIAVAQEVRRRDPQARIVFVGSAMGLETRLVPRAGFRLVCLSVSGLRRMGWLRQILGLLRLPLAVLQSLWLVGKFRPELALSVGGYAAGPALVAAKVMRVPCVIMEPNAMPGLTNRLLGYLAEKIITSMPTKLLPPAKVQILGNPVRVDLLRVRETPYAPHSPLRLLVLGGSRGAVALNNVMIALVGKLKEQSLHLEILHQTGEQDFDRVLSICRGMRERDVSEKTWRCVAFENDMVRAYEWCDLLLCRSGATTLAEVTACGRPSVLVPFPYAVDDHQTANAQVLVAASAAMMRQQSDLDTEWLWQCLKNLSTHPETLVAMAQAARNLGRPQATANIVDALTDVVAAHSREHQNVSR